SFSLGCEAFLPPVCLGTPSVNASCHFVFSTAFSSRSTNGSSPSPSISSAFPTLSRFVIAISLSHTNPKRQRGHSPQRTRSPRSYSLLNLPPASLALRVGVRG